MNGYIPALTSLRGIAAIFIVAHHTVGSFLPELGTSIGWFALFFKKCYLWVDFFFVLSGFILSHVYQDAFRKSVPRSIYRRFIAARFSRIYPVHIAVLMTFIMLAYFQAEFRIGQGFSGNQTILSIFTNIGLLQVFHFSSWNEPAWAISAEWLIYLCLPSIIYVISHTGKSIDSSVFALAMLAVITLNRLSGTLDFVGWKALARCAAEMTMGVLAYKYRLKGYLASIPDGQGLNIGLGCAVLVSMALDINHALTVFIFPILIVCASKQSGKSFWTNPALTFLGKISYSIYMIHWLLWGIINTVSVYTSGRDLHLNFNSPQLFAIGIAFMASVIAAAWAVYDWVEMPARSRLNGLQRMRDTKLDMQHNEKAIV